MSLSTMTILQCQFTFYTIAQIATLQWSRLPLLTVNPLTNPHIGGVMTFFLCKTSQWSWSSQMTTLVFMGWYLIFQEIKSCPQVRFSIPDQFLMCGVLAVHTVMHNNTLIWQCGRRIAVSQHMCDNQLSKLAHAVYMIALILKKCSGAAGFEV